jgi:hypothetical protein
VHGFPRVRRLLDAGELEPDHYAAVLTETDPILPALESDQPWEEFTRENPF